MVHTYVDYTIELRYILIVALMYVHSITGSYDISVQIKVVIITVHTFPSLRTADSDETN